MNKQTVHNSADPAGNLLEAGRATKSNLDSSSTIPRKYKVILILAGVLATIAICTVVAIAAGLSITLKLHTQASEYDREQHDNPVDNMEDSDQMFMNVRPSLHDYTSLYLIGCNLSSLYSIYYRKLYQGV